MAICETAQSLPKIAITMRVVEHDAYVERRDCLDQKWYGFAKALGVLLVPLPNDPVLAPLFFKENEFVGLILSGGNDLVSYGGDAPERDQTEQALLDCADEQGLPVLGVCRGMQLMQVFAGGSLVRFDGHVATTHCLSWQNQDVEVNSFHNWAVCEAAAGFDVLARHSDGVIEAMIHKKHKWLGVMWHPERQDEFADHDLKMAKDFFEL